jgi:nicotinate-nucleotide adenylyltransferase
MSLGVLGGTFDPVHLGHLALAEEAWRQLKLEEVLFIPAGRPYFKATEGVSPAADRLKMLELALSGHLHFQISLLEIERKGPSYAFDTITQLKKQYGEKTEIFFMMGWDSVMALPLWQKPQELLRLCRIVAAPRPGYPPPDVTSLEKDLPGISHRVIVMSGPHINISSSDIRRRVREGLPFEDLVPAEVGAYIKERSLYLGRQ